MKAVILSDGQALGPSFRARERETRVGKEREEKQKLISSNLLRFSPKRRLGLGLQ